MRAVCCLAALVLWINGCDDGGTMPVPDASEDASPMADAMPSEDASTLAPLGTPCGDGTTCASGQCVDGVCCDSACDGACASCGSDGLCAPLDSGMTCRAASDVCDVPETCDGVALACPDDAFASAETTCGDYVCSSAAAACPESCDANTDCAAGAACVGGACVDVKWAFITSTTSNGALGGLSGADATCQARAEAAGLPGSYRAWLADDLGSPSTRFTPSSVPYVMPSTPTATLLAQSYVDLTDGSIAHAFDVNELGVQVTTNAPWSNVTSAGGSFGAVASCDRWTRGMVAYSGGIGDLTATGNTWTDGGGGTCNAVRRLRCLQQ